MGTTTDKLQKILDSKNAIKIAIEDKGVQNVGDILSEYAEKIASIQTGGGSGWTGHADVEGLKAIGWTDKDIAYYQEHGVNWNEEDDQYHLVPEDNKALYGVINFDNIKDYKDILVYLPKIDTTGVTNMSGKFQNCYSLVAVPMMDTSSVTNMSQMFYNCYSLISAALLNTSNSATVSNIFNNCRSLVSITEFDFSNATIETTSFSNCSSLRFCNIRNLKGSVDISATSLLEKSSLLYMIENAAPTKAIIITLSAYCYNKYSVDPDVIAALEKQSLVTLASA